MEERLLVRLAALLPAGTRVCIVADRGLPARVFTACSAKNCASTRWCRFAACAGAQHNRRDTPRGRLDRTDGQAASAAPRGGDRRAFPGRHRDLPQGCRHEGAGCLAASPETAGRRTLTALYASRCTIETGFRDAKTRASVWAWARSVSARPERRDRLWRVAALAVALLTVLGASGEALGYDRMLKTNTSKTRSFRQGCMLYDLIPHARGTPPAADRKLRH